MEIDEPKTLVIRAFRDSLDRENLFSRKCFHVNVAVAFIDEDTVLERTCTLGG